MKRILLLGVAVIAVLAVLVMGLVFVVAVTPLRAQVVGAIARVVEGQPVLAAPDLQAAATQLTLKTEKGILVGGVFTGSPADKAGIARGDIILKIDDQEINTNADLQGILAKHKAGDALSLLVQHGDTQKTVAVTLAAPVNAAGAVTKANPQATPPAGANKTIQKASLPFLGILPIGVGNKIGMFNGGMMTGVITQVAAGSPAEKAGLKVGERITAVDGTALGAQNTLATLIASHEPGDSVKLSVTGTDGASRDVTVALGDNPNSAGKAYLGVSVAGGARRFFRGGPGGMGMMPGVPGNPNGGNGTGNGANNGQPFQRRLAPGLAGHQGAVIDQVTSGSPAEKAGLKVGQLIVSVDGKPVDSQTALSDAITGHKPGDTVTLSVFDPTTSQTGDVKVTLGDNPQKAGTAWMGISYMYINPQPNQVGTSF